MQEAAEDSTVLASLEKDTVAEGRKVNAFVGQGRPALVGVGFPLRHPGKSQKE